MLFEVTSQVTLKEESDQDGYQWGGASGAL